MASTRRESTASYRSEDAIESAGSGLIPALGFGPHHSTSVDAILQEFDHLKLPVREPMISCIGDAIDIAYDSHSKTHGSTVSLIHGNLSGRKLFSVAIYPRRTIELRTPPTRRQLFSFALANLHLLLKPAHGLGTWYDKHGSLHHFLDVVVAVADLQQALELGHEHGQRFVYDLEHQEEIAIPQLVPLNNLSSVVEGGND